MTRLYHGTILSRVKAIVEVEALLSPLEQDIHHYSRLKAEGHPKLQDKHIPTLVQSILQSTYGERESDRTRSISFSPFPWRAETYAIRGDEAGVVMEFDLDTGLSLQGRQTCGIYYFPDRVPLSHLTGFKPICCTPSQKEMLSRMFAPYLSR